MEKDRLAYVVVDEAHCVHEMGRDFRPQYRQLSELREFTDRRNIPWLALTATATREVQEDILKNLKFKLDHNVFKSDPRRDNIYLDVRFKTAVGDVIQDMKEFIFGCLGVTEGEWKSDNGSIIVYCNRIEDTKVVAEQLTKAGVKCLSYHSKMKLQDRDRTQKQWTEGKVPVIAATNAFGMGIDKANVRGIIHNNVPASPPAYLQEFGRAGRDGEQSYARIYVDSGETLRHAYAVSKDEKETRLENCKLFDNMARFCETLECRHKAISNHFGWESEACDGQCDVCANPENTRKHLEDFWNEKLKRRFHPAETDVMDGGLSKVGQEPIPSGEAGLYFKIVKLLKCFSS